MVNTSLSISNDSNIQNVLEIKDKVKIKIFTIKFNVDDILNGKNFNVLYEKFCELGFSNYYDFYFIEVKDFVEFLKNNSDLLNIFKNLVGRHFIKNSQINRENILTFVNEIGFKKLEYNQLKDQIINELSNIGITNINELSYFGLNEFKKVISTNSYIRYFLLKKYKKSYANITSEEMIGLGKTLGFEDLSYYEILLKIKCRLNKKNIECIEDLEKINVRDFWEYVKEDNLLNYFFLSKNIFLSDITRNDINNLGKEIGLKNKENDTLGGARQYLKENHIFEYKHIRELGINGARDFLGANLSCREILEKFGVKYLANFREEHLKRFSRFIGLAGVPEEKLVTKENTIQKIYNILDKNGIDCDYSLKLKGVKFIKTIFKEKNIGEVLYNEINGFIKLNLNLLITKLQSENLDSISKILNLPVLTDLEHKEKLEIFLLNEGKTVETLSKNDLKVKYWHHVQCRYFLEKIGVTDVKLLRLNHLQDFKEYIKRI